MPYTKKFLLVSLIVISLLAAYICLRWAAVDILETQIRYQLGKAQTVSENLDANQWQLTRNMLDNTLSMRQGYAGYYELAAFFNQIVASRPQAILDELAWFDSQEQALQNARQGLLRRPTWPYLWDRLLQSKINLKQFDQELSGAMQRTLTLAPWEYSLNYDIAFTGLENWQNLPLAAQSSVLTAMEQTLLLAIDTKPLQKTMQENVNMILVCQRVKNVTTQAFMKLGQYCRQS